MWYLLCKAWKYNWKVWGRNQLYDLSGASQKFWTLSYKNFGLACLLIQRPIFHQFGTDVRPLNFHQCGLGSGSNTKPRTGRVCWFPSMFQRFFPQVLSFHFKSPNVCWSIDKINMMLTHDFHACIKNADWNECVRSSQFCEDHTHSSLMIISIILIENHHFQ